MLSACLHGRCSEVSGEKSLEERTSSTFRDNHISFLENVRSGMNYRGSPALKAPEGYGSLSDVHLNDLSECSFEISPFSNQGHIM